MSASPKNLFKINEDAPKLSDEKQVAFQNMVAKGLNLTKQPRPDVCVSIAFLTTHVRMPDVDDWKKLNH